MFDAALSDDSCPPVDKRSEPDSPDPTNVPEICPSRIPPQPDTLELMQQMLPMKPYSTDYLPWGLRIRKREKALKCSYIQFNTPWKTIALVVDIDHGEGSAFRYEDCGLPQPTFIVINPENANAHYIYLLKNPVFSKHSKAVRYFKMIQTAYTKILGGDPGYTGLIAKNPLSTTRDHYMWWRVIRVNRVFSLDELAEYIQDFDHKKGGKENRSNNLKAYSGSEYALLGRNCTLFETGRRYAYGVVSNVNSLESLLEKVLACLNANNDGGLSEKELYGIAKSISKWTWKRRHSFEGRGKKLDLPPKLTVKERQKAGADYVNKLQKETTEGKIREVIEAMRNAGQKVSKSAVARNSGLSRDTVYRYLHLFAEA